MQAPQTRPPTIVGAGLAGLIAAHAWPLATVLEAAPAPRSLHRALLRFRSDAVANLTGIEFRKVRVHKGIWSAGKFVQPNIRVANQYAQKVLGRIAGDRSIWNLESVDRYVAPDTFYEQLVATAGSRIRWGWKADLTAMNTCVITTAPLPVTLDALQIEHTTVFERAPITVVRCAVRGADVFQTVYFPDEETPMYRASITGHTLIIEAMNSEVASKEWLPRALTLVSRAFGVGAVQVLETVEQQYGKIAPIPDDERKRLLFEITQRAGIYSLGRFATWRNVLLDDVVKDVNVIKRLMKSNLYDVKRSIG